MKLELLDTYHIRVRLSASIIVLAPVAITIFLCFQEIATIASSSILIAVLLSLTNYLPIEADLPKETSVQKLCSAIPHAK